MRRILATFGICFMLLMAAAPAFAESGGITAGGGGSTNPNPVGAELIRRIVYDSKFLLQAFLNQQEHWWQTVIIPGGHRDDELKFLFDRPDSARQYLDRLIVELNSKAACRDLNGTETDGSVHAKQPGAICISSLTLGNKLNELNFEYEVPALIMHEIVHQMGGNEEIALKIQTKTVYALFKKSLLDMKVDYSMFAKHLGETSVQVRMLANAAITPDPAYAFYQSVFDNLLRMRDEFSKSWNVHPLHRVAREKFEAQVSKILIEKFYACSIAPELAPSAQAYCSAQYLKGFGGSPVVTLQEFFKNLNGLDGETYGGETVTRISEKKILQNELQAIANVLDATKREVELLDRISFQVIE